MAVFSGISRRRKEKPSESLLRYLILASMPKIDSLTRQLIPFARTALRPLRLFTNIVSLVANKHSYHNGSTTMIPAAASSSSCAIAHNYESDGRDRLSATSGPRFALHGRQRLFALIIIWSRDQSSIQLISSVMVTLYFFIGARLEEKKLLREYGRSYEVYMRHVTGIIPRPWKTLSTDRAKQILEQKE